MQTVKVNFDPSDLTQLDLEAKAVGLSRSELIRQRTLTRTTGGKAFTTQDYHRLVSETTAFMRGALDRRQVETIVAFTITKALG